MNKILLLISNCAKTNDIKPHIREFMKNKLYRYSNEWSLFQKAYHEIFLNQSTSIPVCPVCGNRLKYRGLKAGYAMNCSYKCRASNPYVTLKSKDTCLQKFGTPYASQSVKFREAVKDTCIEKFGVDNAFKDVKIQGKYKKTIQDKYGVSNISKSTVILGKIRESHIRSGKWIADEQRSDIELYRLEVARITARSYHDYFYKINPTNVKRSRYQYHLDHIFSVEEGFKQGIPAEIIGHHSNLRMMWHSDNCVKNTKCHKTKEQLLEDYQRDLC
jgi:hypothetical protein